MSTQFPLLSPNGALGAASESAHGVLEWSRMLLGYFAFVATLTSSMALLLKRDFVGAAMASLAELAEVFANLQRHAQTIVAFWNTHVSAPVQALVLAHFDIELPLWAIDVLTLAVFAVGPTVRALWTAHAMRSQIRHRLARVEDLKAASEAVKEHIESEAAIRKDLEESIASHNWDRAKSALRILGGLGLGALSALNYRSHHAGQSVTAARVAYKEMQSGSDEWKAASNEVKRLNRSIAARKQELRELQTRIETALAQDDGLLRSLLTMSPREAAKTIRELVASRMSTALFLSKASMGVVAAVVGAHALDWFL
jgi:predicted transcriptional regulator